jgi:trimethylamine--corrinoid protein Co-methyltransferase
MTVLSGGELKAIHEATIDILDNCGVKILSEAMLDVLAAKGLPVDRKTQTVRFGRSVIEDAVTTVPDRIEMFDRGGRPAFIIGEGVPKVAAGHNAVFWVDSETGKTRNSTVADVEQFARICDALDDIDMIGIPVMPQDIPRAEATLLYGVKAVIENSSKPIFFSTDRMDVNHAVIELLRAAFEGEASTQAYGISQLSPTSPLFWEASVIEAVMDTVAHGVPLAILPEPIAGLSAPYTLAGLITMNNAECLSGIAMAQLLRKGSKVLYANSWTTANMQNCASLVGSAETTLCRIAGAQLAQFYGVPCHTTAPNSDNHDHDEQNAWEKTFSMLCAQAAGNDLIVNCGMFATGLTCSHEQLIMDAEISGFARRICRGIEVDDDHIAKELIKTIGPRGDSYLITDHTMEWLHSDEYYRPIVSVNGPRTAGRGSGNRTAHSLAKDMAARHACALPRPPAGEAGGRLKAIIDAFEHTRCRQ